MNWPNFYRSFDWALLLSIRLREKPFYILNIRKEN